MSDPSTHTRFRDALGAFATGVTIATTLDESGDPVGVTASSFNSVSLDPPLVLWSLAKESKSRPAFCASGHFAVHVLTAAQEALSNRFARSGEDKFADVDWHKGQLGSPVLQHYAARFECRTRHQYEGGDHIIMVGEVIDFESRDEAPLLFHGGRYADHRPRPVRSAVDMEHGHFSDDFLFQLVSRAHYATSRSARGTIAALDLSMAEYLALALLSRQSPQTGAQLANYCDDFGYALAESDITAMVRRDLLAATDGGFEQGEEGRRRFLEVLAAAKARETDLADQLTDAELAEAKRLLRKIIALAEAG
ncbi:flavin reductase [Altererythrobacter sp. CAU 1778]